MTITLFLATLLVADAPPAGVNKDALKKLEGKWSLTRRQHGGENGDYGAGEAESHFKPDGLETQDEPAGFAGLEQGEASLAGESAEPEAAGDQPEPSTGGHLQGAPAEHEGPAGPPAEETQRSRQTPIPLEVTAS